MTHYYNLCTTTVYNFRNCRSITTDFGTILNTIYSNYVPNLVTKFSNRKLYQSQKLPNKATLSRK